MEFDRSAFVNNAMNFGFVPAGSSRQTGLAPHTLFSDLDQG